MISSEILAKGVERGIITAEQAERLRALENAGEPPELPVSPDDEQLRFISGFSDVFVTVLLVALHYWRFRVPITIAAGCAALTGTVFSLFYGLVPNLPPVAYNAVIFVCGLAVFAFAMQFDMADPERRTRRTDIAFWL